MLLGKQKRFRSRPIYQTRPELTPNVKHQPCRVFVQNDLVEKKLKAVENHQIEF